MDFSAFSLPLNHTAIDRCHGAMVFGTLLAHKPKNILELGMGTGFVTRLILSAIDYNRCGKLTCVDSWLDFGGKPDYANEFEAKGATVITSGEKEFIFGCRSNTYDFIFSDADHGGTWQEQHLRVATPGAILFFHDTNNPSEYPGLSRIRDYACDAGHQCIHFTDNSRDDENCHRGLLMIKKSY